jgi:membrane protein required for colicin V production
VNLFDLVAGLTLLISALIGFSRGAVLEVVTLFAFTAAAALSVYLLPFTTPLALKSVHPAWAANAVAAGVSFLIAYIGFRLAGASLSRAVRSQATLGSLDRTVGLAFGVTRALVVLGVVYLVFTATPLQRPPELITSARLYPLARGSGLALASLAPGGISKLQGFGASLKNRMSGETPQPPDGPVEAGQAHGEPDGSAPPPPPDDTAPPPARTLRIEGGSPSPHHHHHRPAAAPEE